MYTKRCVRCMKKATIYGGHVLMGRRKVIAGWCSQRCADADGFSGLHIPRMGVQTRKEIWPAK